MAVLVPNAAIRQGLLGLTVSRAAALLPATATGNIFTVTGGRILLVSLIGEQVVVAPATANTLKVSTAPTVGTAVDLCAASAALANAAAGVHYTLPAAAATALVTDVGAPVGGGVIVQAVRWLIPAGAISITTTGTAATGTVKWDLSYIPLDLGVTVAAA
jgi:hypothetical protein